MKDAEFITILKDIDLRTQRIEDFLLTPNHDKNITSIDTEVEDFLKNKLTDVQRLKLMANMLQNQLDTLQNRIFELEQKHTVN